MLDIPSRIPLTTGLMATRRYQWSKSLPFLLFHLSPLALIWIGFSWQGVAICLASYVLRMFGVTAGYHRYFSHRSYKTGRVFQFLLACLAQSSLQKGVLWWAGHHRHHHWHSDKEADVHSPARTGFWYSHMGWIMSDEWDETDPKRVRDLAKYPELVWIDRWHLVPGVVYAALLTALFGLEGLVWGFGVSTVLLWHGTFAINSVAHVLGNRVYETTDTSRNSLLLALITLGEGWHNNHHYFQRSCAQGWRWFELDITYLTLRALQGLRVVEGVGKPPAEVIANTIDARVLRAHAEKQQAEALGALGSFALGLPAEARQMRVRLEALALEMQELRSRMEEEGRTYINEMVQSANQTLEPFQAELEARHNVLRERAAQIREQAESIRAELNQMRERATQTMQDELDQLSAALHASFELPAPAMVSVERS